MQKVYDRDRPSTKVKVQSSLLTDRLSATKTHENKIASWKRTLRSSRYGWVHARRVDAQRLQRFSQRGSVRVG